MTIKFQRESFRSGAQGSHGASGPRSRFRNASPKQQLLIIYIGILFFCIVIMISHLMGFMPQAARALLQEGQGVVVEKEIQAPDLLAPRYFITIEVLPGESDEGNAPVLSGRVEVPEGSYFLVEKGSQVTVQYVVKDQGTGITIHGISISESASGGETSI